MRDARTRGGSGESCAGRDASATSEQPTYLAPRPGPAVPRTAIARSRPADAAGVRRPAWWRRGRPRPRRPRHRSPTRAAGGLRARRGPAGAGASPRRRCPTARGRPRPAVRDRGTPPPGPARARTSRPDAGPAARRPGRCGCRRPCRTPAGSRRAVPLMRRSVSASATPIDWFGKEWDRSQASAGIPATRRTGATRRPAARAGSSTRTWIRSCGTACDQRSSTSRRSSVRQFQMSVDRFDTRRA